ncbi:MAG: LysR family transcriptional regulator [Lactobacillus sp.]|jgi:DNA-binding transcriptional LysR family regulator|nr:LysR family transcriptional regulator [Lactobacillus sp.]MCI2032410.1 LysR family transcriptional regulator [Lactobacillus sp.]
MKNLATFKMVYETRSFSKAAALLFISQPTVSAQIKQLEAEFHTPLFIRNGRGELGLTTAATQLYQEATTILTSWDQLHLKLATGPQQQRTRIIASHTFATYLLPALLSTLYTAFPAVTFSVQMANSFAVQTAVANHDADLGFIEKPLAGRGLTRTPLMTDQLVLAGQQGPWLVREPESGVAYYTHRYLAEQNIQTPQVEIASNAVIVALLHKGFGRSIISQRASTGLANTSLGQQYLRHFYLLTRNDDGPNKACRQMVIDWAQADAAHI